MRAPISCPHCGETEGWKLIDTTNKGVSGGKALLGGILLGPIGLAAGALGKKKSLYLCTKCNFSHEYDEAPKIKPKECYKNKGINAVYIDIVVNATPFCPFCGLPQNLYIKQQSMSYYFKCENCSSEFKCDFSFGGKVKSNSVQIMSCGNVNINNYQNGLCDASIIINDKSKIKE